MNPNMSPLDWAKRPLQKYADFSGRAPRSEYWWYFLGLIIAEIVATILDSLIGTGNVVGVYGWVVLLLILATIIPTLAVSVRRLHDTDHSGWWLLIAFIPLIGAIFLLIWYCTASDAGDNKYGAPPLAGSQGAVPAE